MERIEGWTVVPLIQHEGCRRIDARPCKKAGGRKRGCWTD